MRELESNRYSTSIRAFVTQQYRYLGIVVIAALLGIVVATIGGQAPTESQDREDTWSMPQDLSIAMTSSLETMLANPMFGGEPVVIAEPEITETAEEEVILSDWQLIGIVTEGSQCMILFKEVNKTGLKEGFVGDVLPGGEELVSISDNTIEIRQNGEVTLVSLFQDLRDLQE